MRTSAVRVASPRNGSPGCFLRLAPVAETPHPAQTDAAGNQRGGSVLSDSAKAVMRSDVDFEALVREHLAALYRFALSMTRSEADAADLVQETFLRWAERGHQLLNPAKVKTWLFTTLYREATGRRRRLTRFPQMALAEVQSELPDIPPDAPSSTDGRLVLEALGQVDEVYRVALALFYLEDYSYPEIAEILDVPLGTVKSRIARGVAQLQRLLNPQPAVRGGGKPSSS